MLLPGALEGVDDLAPAAQPALQFGLPGLGRHMRDASAHGTPRHLGQHARVEVIGLGQLAGGPGEVARLPRIDPGDPQAGLGTGLEHGSS